jgi:3-deoxy-D-manno-octulosonic-acid transferase
VNLTERLYRLASVCLAGPTLAWLWWRGRPGRGDVGYRLRLQERLGFIETRPESMGGLWLHAASVGEVQAAQPLIEQLLRQWPDSALTVSTQTPTGAAALKAHWSERVRHVYAPLDTPGASARFLARLQPRLLILVEREIWPEWLRQCRAQVIPVALVNARLSERSARGYQRWAKLMGPVWPQLHVAAADQHSAAHLLTLGVPPSQIQITGNLKFDVAAPPPRQDVPSLWPKGARDALVAGSTHEGDEELLLSLWPTLQAAHPRALLVLVPRHPQRFDAVASRLAQSGLRWVRQSSGQAVETSTQVLLVDAMGQLMHWYAQAHVCLVGGTFAPVGGHNPLEPLSLGQPIVFGPHTHNAASLFADIAASGVGQCAADGAALQRMLDEALAPGSTLQSEQTPKEAPGPAHPPRAQVVRDWLEAHAGASERTTQILATLWASAEPQVWSPARGHQQGADSFWLDPQCMARVSAEDFDLARHHHSTALATGSGRGQAHSLQLGTQAMVLRHYRRGGLVAKISHDLFWRTAVHESRAMREFNLLRLMRSWQLPVPLAVAARHHGRGLFYQADILIGLIPDTLNLAQCLVQRPVQQAEWEAIGRAIRRMHDHQVFHSDLNIHNLLLDTQGRAWIVDFDKCGLRPGEDWKAQNLARLQRSLRKEASRLSPFFGTAADWDGLLSGYETSTATQPPESGAP